VEAGVGGNEEQMLVAPEEIHDLYAAWSTRRQGACVQRRSLDRAKRAGQSGIYIVDAAGEAMLDVWNRPRCARNSPARSECGCGLVDWKVIDDPDHPIRDKKARSRGIRTPLRQSDDEPQRSSPARLLSFM